jgi:poly-beta-hydroxyalkanoate depolymerase
MTQLNLYNVSFTTAKDTTDAEDHILVYIIYYSIVDSTTQLYLQNTHKYFQVINNVLFRNKICILALRSTNRVFRNLAVKRGLLLA